MNDPIEHIQRLAEALRWRVAVAAARRPVWVAAARRAPRTAIPDRGGLRMHRGMTGILSMLILTSTLPMTVEAQGTPWHFGGAVGLADFNEEGFDELDVIALGVRF